MTSSNLRRAFIHERSSEITPQGIYLRRRQMIQALAGGAAGAAMASWGVLSFHVSKPSTCLPMPPSRSFWLPHPLALLPDIAATRHG